MDLTSTTVGFIENIRITLFQENYEYFCVVTDDTLPRKHSGLRFQFLIPPHQVLVITPPSTVGLRTYFLLVCESLQCFALRVFSSHMIGFYFRDLISEHGWF